MEQYKKDRSLLPSLLEHSKIPPQAVDLEESIIGVVINNPNSLIDIVDILVPEMFYKQAHQTIFKAIINLFKRCDGIDLLTVNNELKTLGELDNIGGTYYISQLVTKHTYSSHIENHARIVIQKYIQREIIKECAELSRDSYQDSTDTLELLSKANKAFDDINKKLFRKDFVTAAVAYEETIEQMRLAGENPDNLTGVPSGFHRLDSVTNGFQKSDLIILAARPSMGKTAFTLQIAGNVAINYKKPTAFFSLEMTTIQLMQRLISSETEIMAEKIKTGKLDSLDWDVINSKSVAISQAPLYIDDTPALTILELRAKTTRLKQKYSIELVVIDYLQLMLGAKENRGNREQEISNISRSLKALAKDLDIPIIVLSQLSRAVETRGGNKQPILSDLRESGAIEQDADLVMFLYRPEYYKITQDEEGNTLAPGTTEILIAKHRNGRISDVKVFFNNIYTKFYNNEFIATNDYTESNVYNNKLVKQNNGFDKNFTDAI